MWEIIVRTFACIGTVGVVLGILKAFCFFRDRIRNKKIIFSTEILFVENNIGSLKINDKPFYFYHSKGIVLRIRNKSDILQQITNIKFKSLSGTSIMLSLPMFLSVKYVENNYSEEIIFSEKLVFPIKIEALCSKDIYIKSPDFEHLLCCGNKILIETGDGKTIINAPFDFARHNIY